MMKHLMSSNSLVRCQFTGIPPFWKQSWRMSPLVICLNCQFEEVLSDSSHRFGLGRNNAETKILEDCQIFLAYWLPATSSYVL